jgi:hypothetical protein
MAGPLATRASDKGTKSPIPMVPRCPTVPAVRDIHLGPRTDQRVSASYPSTMTIRTTSIHLVWASTGILLVAFSLSFSLAPLRAAAATSEPRGGIVQVTGYSSVRPSGSVGPVAAVVTGRKAAAIRSALAGLRTTSSSPSCQESMTSFRISVLPRWGGRPTWVATESDCPTPGLVVISVDGMPMPALSEDCSLRAAVVAALSPGKAEGTRHDKARCSL